ncbi:hypothetical protein M5D96_002535, partial [Drosophila gunungcola]
IPPLLGVHNLAKLIINCKGEPKQITNLGKQKLEPPTKMWFAKHLRRSLFCGHNNYESFALKINRMENLIPTVALWSHTASIAGQHKSDS